MSVWASIITLDDDHTEGCDVWVDGIAPGIMRRDDTRPCTCGTPSAPWQYQKSHIVPSVDDTRGGVVVALAEIPSHITRDARDDQPEDGPPWPWLRLSVGQDDAVINESQAEAIRDALSGWLAHRRSGRGACPCHADAPGAKPGDPKETAA